MKIYEEAKTKIITSNNIHLTLTVYKLATHGVHFEFIKPGEVERELVKMVDLMRAEFERPRADRSELLISIIRNTIFRDWRFLCGFPGRPRQRGKPSTAHYDPYMSFYCHYVLLGNRTGVAVFDEMLAAMREAVGSRSAAYEAAMDFPSTDLCLAQVVAIHNERHPSHQISCIVPANQV